MSYLLQLCEMTGRSEDDVVVALHDAKDDADKAVEILLEGGGVCILALLLLVRHWVPHLTSLFLIRKLILHYEISEIIYSASKVKDHC